MTREELRKHCENQIKGCEMWASYKGEEPHGKVYEEHKLILELLEQEPKTVSIPDGATNGDVVKIMFPYGKYGINGNEVHVFGVGGNGCLVFTLDWWNAPYKSEVEADKQRGTENE